MNRRLHDYVVSFAWNKGYYLVTFVSRKRTAHLAKSRFECWSRLKQIGFGYQEIAEFFGRTTSDVEWAFSKRRVKRKKVVGMIYNEHI